MKRLSQLEAPAPAGVIREDSTQKAIAEIRNCRYNGATMIDLHMSCLADDSTEALRAIIGSAGLPVLALNYNKTFNWQDAGYSEEDRIKSFERAVEAGAAGIDLQGYSFDAESRDGFHGEDKYSFTGGNPREIVTDTKVIAKQCEFIEKIHSMGAEVLLSCHPGKVMSCEQVVELALFLEQRKPDIIKIVTAATNEEQLLECFKTMVMLKKEVKTPISYHTSGKAGILSRIVNPLLGGQIAFCVDNYNEGSTMEQVNLKCAVEAIENIKRML